MPSQRVRRLRCRFRPPSCRRRRRAPAARPPRLPGPSIPPGSSDTATTRLSRFAPSSFDCGQTARDQRRPASGAERQRDCVRRSTAAPRSTGSSPSPWQPTIWSGCARCRRRLHDTSRAAPETSNDREIGAQPAAGAPMTMAHRLDRPSSNPFQHLSRVRPRRTGSPARRVPGR